MELRDSDFKKLYKLRYGDNLNWCDFNDFCKFVCDEQIDIIDEYIKCSDDENNIFTFDDLNDSDV